MPTNWAGYSNFEENDFDYICVEDFPDLKDDQTLEDISLDSFNNSVGSEITNFVTANIFDCIIWNYSENNLLPGRIEIATFRADPDTCEPLRNIFHLSGYDDIAKAIDSAEIKRNGMRNLLRKLSENATSHLKKVWPEYKNLSIDLSQNGGVIEAGVEDEFNIYSLDRRSDGFKRFVTFLLMISAQAKADYLYDTVIIIDEPDIGLHPSGIQFLREELKKVAKGNIVIIATHSIFMVDKDRIDRHLIIKKEKEETTITSDYTSTMLDEEVIYKALGYSLFDLLKKRNIIFEGWSDKHVFQCWLSSSSAKKAVKDDWKDIGMIHALGAKDVQRVASHLESFDREYIVLSDADKPSLDWQSKFEGNYSWITYKDLGFSDKETIEDFLENDYVINKILSVLKMEQLDKGVNFENCITFNSRIDAIIKTIRLSTDESNRLKKLVKNAIFDNIHAKNIDINALINAIDITSNTHWK